MKERLKNGLIVLLIVLIGLFGLFGGKRVIKYQSDIAALKTENGSLALQKILLQDKIDFQEKKIDLQKDRIDSCMKVFTAKDKVIAGLTKERDDALGQLIGITSDSSYQFLQKIAYNFPGSLKYLFNELQVKGIHADWIRARSAEKVIPEFEAQILNAKKQFADRDTLEAGLNKIIGYQKESLSVCEKSGANKDLIIKDTEKERNKERHRKNFWRFTSSVEAGVIIAIILFGL